MGSKEKKMRRTKKKRLNDLLKDNDKKYHELQAELNAIKEEWDKVKSESGYMDTVSHEEEILIQKVQTKIDNMMQLGGNKRKTRKKRRTKNTKKKPKKQTNKQNKTKQTRKNKTRK